MNEDDIVRVTITMSRKQHKALKQYAGFFGVSQSEFVNDCLGFFWNKFLPFCTLTQSIFQNLNLLPDKRRQKPCFGPQCYVCSKRIECRTGLYQGVVHVCANCRPLMTVEAKASCREFQLAHNQAPQWRKDLIETILSHKYESDSHDQAFLPSTRP